MKKNSSILGNKNTITSIAIGGFDGMHCAHQELFKELDKNGAVLVIDSGYANLTPKNYRQEYSEFPVFFYLLEDIKHFEAEEFINFLKQDFPSLKKIVVGFDFCFGKNRKYNTNDLKKLFKGKIQIINEIKIDNISVHSRIIRDYLKKSDIEFANKLLGKEYKIYGKKLKGQGLGSKEFVPTINIKVKDFLLPKEGVYATKTIVDLKEYNSISFLGHRVSTDGNFAVETHIIDKNISIKNSLVQIKFIKEIRENKKFDNFQDLKSQILEDITSASNILKNT